MRSVAAACLDVFMASAQSSPQRPRTTLALFGFLFSLYLLTSSGRVRTLDEVLPDLETESLVTRGTLSVPQAVASGIFYGEIDRYGQPQAPYGAGQAIATVPCFALARLMVAVLPGIPAQARDVAADAVVVAGSAAYAALAVSLFYVLLCSIGLDSVTAVLAAMVLALATPVFAYSSWFFSEPLAAALLLAAAVALFPPDSVEDVSVRRAVLAGVALGFAVWVRPTHALAIPPFALAAAVRGRGRGMRSAAIVALVAGIFAAGYLLRNQSLFGRFLEFGYPEAAEGGRRLNTFETPLLTGLYGLLLSPGKSLFLFAPPLLLAVPGLWPLARRSHALAVLAAVTPAIYLLFFARYTQWEGGYCFGPRYLLPVIPLLALGLAPAFASGNRALLFLLAVLAVAGFLVQAIGMSTSFLEDQATGAYYDAHWNYRMTYAPLLSQTQLLLHYLRQGAQAPMGRGFDRWFVFLPKAGVASATIWFGIAFQSAGVLFFGRKLWKANAPGALAGNPRPGLK